MSRLLIFAIFVFSILAFFSSGVLDSEDGWLYLSVAKNLYYTGKATSAPNEYAEQKNVNFNSTKDEQGEWRAPYALGYSISMIPAIALSDLVHKYYNTPPVEHFPLEHDWSIHFFASFTNMIYASFFTVIFVLYLQALGFARKKSFVYGFITLFTTNLFPLSKFSFAHMLFISSMFFSFYCVKRYAQTQKCKFIFYAIASFCWAAIGYNISFALVIPALILYFLLLQPERELLRNVVIFFSILGIWIQRNMLINALSIIHAKTIVEGTWGYLLSSGKSIFVYSPPLIILPLFWHRLQKRYFPEIMSFLLLTATYLIAYASARLTENAYIWHGGMAWGPRYITMLIPFGMLLFFLILKRFSNIQKIFFITPVFLIGFFVQILGVSNSYLVQYRNLPYNLFIGNVELSFYDYPSFIPRFSPIFIMTNELIQRVKDFPYTISHGIYNVRFFDGFIMPLHIGYDYFRGIRTHAFVSFDQLPNTPKLHTLSLDVYHASNNAKANTHPVALTIYLNNQLLATSSAVQPETHGSMEIQVPPNLPQKNLLSFSLSFSATDSANQVLYITRMKMNNTPINLRTIDYPDLSSLNSSVPHEPYRYFGKESTNLWDQWNMRARITENTFDFWWIKNLYYWDWPKMFFWGLFAIDLVTIGISGWYTIKYLRYT